MCLEMPWGGAGETALSPLWPPLLALHAGRLRRYLEHEDRRCHVCLAAFPSAWLLQRHAALQHAATLPSATPPCPHPGDEKPFVCEQCGQSYRYRSAYVKHREQNHRARLPADKLFTCDVCGMQFRYLKSFKKHRLNHTLERLHTKSGDRERIDCVSSTDEVPIGRCGEMDLSLKRRIRAEEYSPTTETTPDTEQDSTVDSNGPSESAATADESVECRNSSVDGERREDECPPSPSPRRRAPASFASVSSLADSSESESRGSAAPLLALLASSEANRGGGGGGGERRFACPFCGKCVRSKENLKLHVRKHTGERPFVCLFCGRAFGGKSDLTRHLRIHTGERPYHCEACGKCFARADYLSKHLTTHVHNAR